MKKWIKLSQKLEKYIELAYNQRGYLKKIKMLEGGEIMIEVLDTKLKGVLHIKPSIFEDFRGQYVEIYNEKLYKEKGIRTEFIEQDISVSTKHVLRGIHGDSRTVKLISCLLGKFYLAVVVCEKDSQDFGKWESFVLSDTNRHQILVPAGYGNAHLVLSDKAIFHYAQSAHYDRQSQFSYKWDDPQFNIWWPIRNPILSQRDEGLDV